MTNMCINSDYLRSDDDEEQQLELLERNQKIWAQEKENNKSDFEGLEFYAVRNREGQWYHRKGLSGYGETWREDVQEARIYNKIGHARAQVTYFARKWPSFGVPEIVVFKVGGTYVINEEERVKKQQEKEEKKVGIRRIKTAREKLKGARYEFDMAQKG